MGKFASASGGAVSIPIHRVAMRAVAASFDSWQCSVGGTGVGLGYILPFNSLAGTGQSSESDESGDPLEGDVWPSAPPTSRPAPVAATSSGLGRSKSLWPELDSSSGDEAATVSSRMSVDTAPARTPLCSPLALLPLEPNPILLSHQRDALGPNWVGDASPTGQRPTNRDRGQILAKAAQSLGQALQRSILFLLEQPPLPFAMQKHHVACKQRNWRPRSATIPRMGMETWFGDPTAQPSPSGCYQPTWTAWKKQGVRYLQAEAQLPKIWCSSQDLHA